MPTRKHLIAAFVAVVVVVGVAFATEFIVAATSTDEYHLRVVRGGAVLADFDRQDLERMELRRVFMQGKFEEGPSLLTVLVSAGVEDFEEVTVVGAGVRDSGRIVLAREEIDEDVLVDLAIRGTAKICGPNIPWDARVRDVMELQVQ